MFGWYVSRLGDGNSAPTERLQGGLQDEKGQPLTPTRIAAIRSSLTEQTPEPSS